MGDLTHLDAEGTARMVDVGAKEVTARRAVARAVVRMTPATAERVAAGDAPKGDVLGVARIAGIQAAKRTGELIPLCHPVGLDHVDVDAELDAAAGTVTLTATAAVTARTGVEMEAMTAAAVAALTVYDMVKGLERGVAHRGGGAAEQVGRAQRRLGPRRGLGPAPRAGAAPVGRAPSATAIVRRSAHRGHDRLQQRLASRGRISRARCWPTSRRTRAPRSWRWRSCPTTLPSSRTACTTTQPMRA